ncbi:CPBP family intramembrane glutamic endopeptidase [Microbacterium sp. MYb64]|uniref:CPBP family intramembrane glutamic endopeptidase n=1 Tax=Microbacterium sp. MYb64 TaxID=1848691 RepID=UPI000CFE2384|nr:CPBP family intramembrane glutamic endopeptidase [Microbacterium sp. MYb64]PRB09082.1 CPBP family intramembrane metalloprotease [Microbacterium sp. MYb64]
MNDVVALGTNGWQRFWNRGGWWKALIAVVAYYLLYQYVPLWTLGPFVGGLTDPAAKILVTTGVPIAFGCVVLIVFAWSIGWLRELFGRQPIRGRGWMWIAVAITLLFNVLHFATIDYATAGAGIVLAWIITGLFIGFAEEVLTRGLVVNLMRKAGHRELTVALVSAALFAAMHAGNMFSGQALLPTLVQLVYTFAFGICMYLALRVTGALIWPILLHATTDPSIFLQSAYPAAGPLTGFAASGNIVVIIAGLVLLIFIRGRVAVPEAPRDGALPRS